MEGTRNYRHLKRVRVTVSEDGVVCDAFEEGLGLFYKFDYDYDKPLTKGGFGTISLVTKQGTTQ